MPRPDAPTAERRIGRYLLQEELGRGGMGVVHAALDEDLGRRVALKLLRPGGPVDDARLGERFGQEMRIAIALEHPNIVPVHETGTADGVRYIAMRLVDGEDLGAVIRREGALPPLRVARLGRQIAAALDAAHARGLVHRDVKPGNVLLTGSGDEEHAYLTDFGLTREPDAGLTQTGQWIGTVDYAAPEQIEAAPLSARTDVYALGCVIFQALTGRLPFTGSFAAKATAHVSAPLPSVGLPGPLGEQIDRLLAVATAKAPERRQASAGALARALARAVAAAEDGAQRTAAMPVLGPDEDAQAWAAGAPEPPTTVQETGAPWVEGSAGEDTGATARRPRAPRPAAASAPARPRARPVPLPAAATPPGADDGPASPGAPAPAPRRRRLAAVGVGAALVALAAVLALSAGGDDGSAPREASATETPAARTPARTGSTDRPPAAPAAQTTPRAPAPVPIPTAAYTAPAGGYTAQVPAGEGWGNQGERDDGGVIRTSFSGPDGQQLWIDATPTLAPAFGREGRTVTQIRTLQGPLGPIVGYRFTGAPVALCGRGCVDYQLDLGGRGYAVLAGPTASARLAARTAILSLQPTAAPPDAAVPPADAPAADAGPAKQPGKGRGKDREKDDG